MKTKDVRVYMDKQSMAQIITYQYESLPARNEGTIRQQNQTVNNDHKYGRYTNYINRKIVRTRAKSSEKYTI